MKALWCHVQVLAVCGRAAGSADAAAGLQRELHGREQPRDRWWRPAGGPPRELLCDSLSRQKGMLPFPRAAFTLQNAKVCLCKVIWAAMRLCRVNEVRCSKKCGTAAAALSQDK